ncbi:hypothetical protein RSOLAG1IB_08216 [Rhizoctonia solani AG-1 IB]|uniref:Uncharacterized protein n=1 Tax=Thanatephorus cucumeris (strain AG1-IB / isolate 7/3/14) TaxID=1108050 RepID=A0A0B7FL22_THACB|nr:hypothetical protein RSOLAG1IB_08216 [Rhizoctonia solani AG-1 IB]
MDSLDELPVVAHHKLEVDVYTPVSESTTKEATPHSGTTDSSTPRSFTWTNPGPLFESSKRIILASFVAAILLQSINIVTSFLNSPSTREVSGPGMMDAMNQSWQIEEPPLPRICCVGNLQFVFQVYEELIPDCGECSKEGRYRTFQDMGIDHYIEPSYFKWDPSHDY